SHIFRQEDEGMVPDHISFNYHVTYRDSRDSVPGVSPSTVREIYSSGIIYCYDYGRPFILPYFEYDESLDDYRKMSIIPYNDVFWNSNNAMLLTEQQKKDLGFFAESGSLINFREGNYGKNFLHDIRNTFGKDSLNSFYYQQFYESNYSFWSPSARIILNRKLQQNEVWKEVQKSLPLSDLYHLKVQLLLDLTELGDSVNCRSYTVFDACKTFYHLPEEPATRAFLNIYFDICEIERRKMEHTLASSHFSPGEIGALYRKTLEGMEEITARYLKEVMLGRDPENLRGWNLYVVNNLGIDNLKLFPVTEAPSSPP
ncbi:MAG TPA: hypothetical protein VMC08_01600, partial [Bacteroidales bacterium]|nr:hypothetical protein [Bacteroidales bacterium]